MAGTKQRAPRPTGEDLVPHTNFKYKQLAHVRRCYDQPIQQGTLLACNGAWDNKCVVAYVVYGGEVIRHGGATYHVFTIGLVPLGKIFADGRMRLGSGKLVREIQVETSDGYVGSYALGRWHTVEVFEPATKQTVLTGGKSGEYTHVGGSWPVVAPDGPSVASMKAAKQAHLAQLKAASATHKRDQRPPEAILADFIIPKAGEIQ